MNDYEWGTFFFSMAGFPRGCKIFQYLWGNVRRAIVYNNHFQVWISLGIQGGQTAVNVAGFIAGGDND